MIPLFPSPVSDFSTIAPFSYIARREYSGPFKCRATVGLRPQCYIQWRPLYITLPCSEQYGCNQFVYYKMDTIVRAKWFIVMFVARKCDVGIDHTLSEVWQQARNCVLHVSVTANYDWRPRLVWVLWGWKKRLPRASKRNFSSSLT